MKILPNVDIACFSVTLVIIIKYAFPVFHTRSNKNKNKKQDKPKKLHVANDRIVTKFPYSEDTAMFILYLFLWSTSSYYRTYCLSISCTFQMNSKQNKPKSCSLPTTEFWVKFSITVKYRVYIFTQGRKSGQEHSNFKRDIHFDTNLQIYQCTWKQGKYLPAINFWIIYGFNFGRSHGLFFFFFF